MPSSSSSRTHLELLAMSSVVGVSILGTTVLVVGPQNLANTLRPDQGFLSIQETGEGLKDDVNDLPLPLLGQRRDKLMPTSIDVPPPIIPQTLAIDAQNPVLQGTSPQRSPFTDLPVSHWAYPMVTELLNHDLVTGFPDGSFRPDQPMSRAEFASQLARAFDLAFVRDTQPFKDVVPDSWAINEIQKSFRMGFLSGYPNQQFRPDETIDRIQVIVALTQGLNLKSSSGSRVLLRYYQDYEQVPDWAVSPLIAATEAGLVVNHPDLSQLTPNRPSSRAEVAATLYRALVYIGHLENIESPHWVEPTPTAY
jgi:hypothetical protein